MANIPDIDNLANELLHDIEVSFNRERPDKSRERFQFLQPYFADTRNEILVERIVLSYEQLPTESDRFSFQEAVSEALLRCATAWLGVDRTLTVVDLAYRISLDFVPSDVWKRLLEREAPASAESTAALLEQLIRRLRFWGITPEVQQVNWNHVIKSVSPSALPTTAEWVLKLLKHDPMLSKAVYLRARQRLFDERDRVCEAWPDLYQADDLLLEAFLDGVSVAEKISFLNKSKIFNPVSEPIIDNQMNREALQRYTNTLNQDVLSPDDEYDLKYFENISNESEHTVSACN